MDKKIRNMAGLREISGLLLACCLGVFLAVIKLNTSLWLDEARGIDIGLRSLTGLITEVAKDNHPPLYYMALAVWMKIFGISGAAVRSLSLAFFTGSIISIYFLARMVYKEKGAALLAALLYACSAIAVRHSINARMYAMVSFIEIWSMILFLKVALENKDTRANTAALIIINILGTFTHYWFLFVILGQLAYCAIFRLKQWKKTLFIYAFSILPLFLLWGPVIYYQGSNGSMNFIHDIPRSVLVDTIKDFFYGKTNSLMGYIAACTGLALFLLWLAQRSLLTVNNFISKITGFFFEEANIFLLISFLTILFVPYVVSRKVIPIYFTGRYTIVTFAPFVVLLAGFAWKFANRPVLWALVVFFIIRMFIANYAYYRYFDISSDSSRAAYVMDNSSQKDALLFVGLRRVPTDYYFLLAKNSFNLPESSFPQDIDARHPCWTNDWKMTPALEKEAALKAASLADYLRKNNGSLFVLDGERGDIDAGVKKALLKEFVSVKSLKNNITIYKIRY